MFWLKRSFEWADYAPYFNRLEKLIMDNAKFYQEFMMVSTKTNDAGISVYYVGLPNEAFSQGFDGFVRVDEQDLPKRIDVVHIADSTKEPFKSRFHFEG